MDMNQMEQVLQQQKQAIEMLSLGVNQQQQIIEQYRVNIYNLELRMALTTKLMEEKGILAKEEFERRWPLYLKNDVGVTGPDGVMDGTLRVSFYGEKGSK